MTHFIYSPNARLGISGAASGVWCCVRWVSDGVCFSMKLERLSVGKRIRGLCCWFLVGSCSNSAARPTQRILFVLCGLQGLLWELMSVAGDRRVLLDGLVAQSNFVMFRFVVFMERLFKNSLN